MRKMLFSLASLAVITGGVLFFALSGQTNAASMPVDCDNNAIIKCGATSAGQLAERYGKDEYGDLEDVYGAYGLSPEEVTNAGKYAKMGTVTRNGEVKVGNEVVATGLRSIGREHSSGETAKNIAGKTYYESPAGTSFAREDIAAYVYFNESGEFKAAIMTACGNPVSAKPKPKPSYKCDALTPKAISRTEYEFTAAASVKNATIDSYSFDFGDGKVVESTNKTIKHAYAKAGNYTAKVTVNVKVGNEIKQATGAQCQAPVKLEEAVYKCDVLGIRTISLEKRQYAYDLSYTVKNGATLKTVDYDFGDGTQQNGLSADAAKTVQHTYAKAGSYTTKATLHFNVDGTVKDVNCQVAVTTNKDMCPLNPTLPKDDERCKPCEIPGKEQYPKDSPECKENPVTPAVTELPKTGPMDMAFGGLGVSALLAAGYYWYNSRRDLAAALLARQ